MGLTIKNEEMSIKMTILDLQNCVQQLQNY